jgi:hypothetical protein
MSGQRAKSLGKACIASSRESRESREARARKVVEMGSQVWPLGSPFETPFWCQMLQRGKVQGSNEEMEKHRHVKIIYDDLVVYPASLGESGNWS